MVEERKYQAVALESPSQSPTESHDNLVVNQSFHKSNRNQGVNNKCVSGSSSSGSSSDDGLDVRLKQPKNKIHEKVKVSYNFSQLFEIYSYTKENDVVKLCLEVPTI